MLASEKTKVAYISLNHRGKSWHRARGCGSLRARIILQPGSNGSSFSLICRRFLSAREVVIYRERREKERRKERRGGSARASSARNKFSSPRNYWSRNELTRYQLPLLLLLVRRPRLKRQIKGSLFPGASRGDAKRVPARNPREQVERRRFSRSRSPSRLTGLEESR